MANKKILQAVTAISKPGFIVEEKTFDSNANVLRLKISINKASTEQNIEIIFNSNFNYDYIYWGDNTYSTAFLFDDNGEIIGRKDTLPHKHTYKIPAIAGTDTITIYDIVITNIDNLISKTSGNFISGASLVEINCGNNIKFDTEDGELVISGNYQDATTSTSGLMSAGDKTKLDNLSGALDANVMYNSAMDDSLATLSALGGIPKGTTAAKLKEKTLSQVFDDLLFPTVQPTVSAPSASISFKSTTTTPTIQEVGTTGSTVPTPNSFNTSFSKGSISINGVKKQDRSGNATTTIIYYGGNVNNTSNFPTVIPDGSISYNCRISYEAGPTPLDSKGNTATSYSALAAGYVDSAAVVVYGVYPYFANSSNNSSFNKLSLTTSTTLSAVKFVAEGPNKHAFKLPAKYTLTKTELLNTLSGKYETFATSNWTVTTENITVQGNTVSYKVYTRNDSGFNGESTYNITFSK
jgi:hypothetical protein